MIDAFLEYLSLEKKYSIHTVMAYQNDLISFQNFCATTYNDADLCKIQHVQVRSWVVELIELGISNRTINRKLSALKSFYKFLQKTHQIEKDPLLKLKLLKVGKKQQVPFSADEINKVIKIIEVKDGFRSVRNKLIVELLYSTGMRRSELIHIKESDINLFNKTIKILGKRNKERLVTLLNSVSETLVCYLELKKEFDVGVEALLITEKGKKIYESLVYRIINSYFSRISTKEKKSPHILRHSFATHLLNEGADLNSVKELLGHLSLASTEVYTQSSLDVVKRIYNQAHPRSAKKKS